MDTPELDKMVAVKEQSQAIGEFMEWLTEEKKMLFFRCNETNQTPERCWDSIESLLGEYFKIDLVRAEAEKLALLSQAREFHSKIKKDD